MAQAESTGTQATRRLVKPQSSGNLISNRQKEMSKRWLDSERNTHLIAPLIDAAFDCVTDQVLTWTAVTAMIGDREGFRTMTTTTTH